MNKTIEIILIILIIGASISLGTQIKGIYLVNLQSPRLLKFDITTKTECGSDSMGLVINCENTLYLRYLKKNEELELGEIYVYKKDNETIVHRLVQIKNDTAIFKGDNNHIAEFVNVSDILYKVEMIQYE